MGQRINNAVITEFDIHLHDVNGYPWRMKGNQHSRRENRQHERMSESFSFPPLFENARKSAVILLRIESFLLTVLVVYLIGAAFLNGVEAPGALAGELLFAAAAAVGLFICSRGFVARLPYGRAPALLANLILMGVSYFMISGHLLWVGSGLALFSSATALASLLGYTE